MRTKKEGKKRGGTLPTKKSAHTALQAVSYNARIGYSHAGELPCFEGSAEGRKE